MRLKTWILCSSAAAAMLAPPAWAQQPPTPEPDGQEAQTQPADPESEAPVQADDAVQDQAGGDEVAAGEEVVVTGLRRSLQSAQNVKRNSEQIVDTIVAEDIGKLPDIAVSDTAARIPGVQVIRRGGEADTVLIRGLPDFSTTYNGREIFTAERREVALQDFPSANIAALEVFKTTTAELVEAGLAGQVNVRSRRPFDFNGLEVAGSVWGLYTRQADSVTPNFNFLVSNRWDTGIGEIGALINVSYTQLKFLDSEPSNTDFLATPTINGQQVRFPDIQRLFYREGDRTRPSVNVALQWRPNDALELYAEGLYQGFRNKISDRLVAVPLYLGGDPRSYPTTYSNLVFREGTDLLRSGTITGLYDPIFTFQGGTFNKTDTYQFAIGGRYDAGPLRVSVDLARTDSTFRGSTESLDRIFAGQATTSVDFDLDTPQFTIRNFNPTNISNFLFDGLYEEAQLSEGDDYQARLDAEYELDVSFLRSIEAGVRYSTRDGHREFGNRFAGFRGQNIPASALPVRYAFNNPGFRGTNVQSGFRQFLTPTYDSIRENRRDLRQFVIDRGATFYTLDPVGPNPVSTYDAQEDTLSGYAQVNLAFGDSVDAIVGLRAVRTDTQVSGTAITAQADPDGDGPLPAPAPVLTPVSNGQEFTDWLPNASVRWRITPEFQLRLSATQTRTRATFEQLNPSTSFGAPDPLLGGRRVGTGGNPLLQPLTSDNYDVSLEYYFARNGFASLAAFRRDLEGFIQTETTDFVDPIFGPVRLTRPVNSRSGRINGLEAQFQTFFDYDFVPDFLRNFGVQANYTYLDAKTEFLNGAGEFQLGRIVLPDAPVDQGGISKHTYNLAAFYEGGGLSARLSFNKRSDFLDRRQFRGDDLFLETANPPGRLDFSTNYTLFENLTLFFDWTNITGDPLRVNLSSARGGADRAEFVRFLRYEETTFSLGARFRL